VFLVVLGVIFTREQNYRTGVATKQLDSDRTAESAARNDEVQARMIEDAKMDAINTVLDKMDLGIKSEIVTQAAAQVRAIAAGEKYFDREVSAPKNGSLTPEQKPLIVRAREMDKTLQGFKADWNAKYDQMQADIKSRWSREPYTTVSPQLGSTYINSDLKEINFREQEINEAEMQYYRLNYENSVQKLRAELIPVAPGVSSIYVSNDNHASYIAFAKVADDFHALVQAYSSNLSPSH
jgi:hypothetical protein